ncbi:MAG: CHC2 zinc finger domain-containing protein [Thermodesulfovibrionales bacterium]
MIKPDLSQVIESEGIILRQRGKDFWACCPLHGEKTPSFKVDPDRQTFYCFGCHEHGDVISFIQKHRGLSFKDAIRYLGMTTGPLTPSRRAEIELQRRKREATQEFRAWVDEYHRELCSLYRCLQTAKRKARTPEEVERIAPSYHKETEWIRRLDILESGSDEEKFRLWKEVKTDE